MNLGLLKYRLVLAFLSGILDSFLELFECYILQNLVGRVAAMQLIHSLNKTQHTVDIAMRGIFSAIEIDSKYDVVLLQRQDMMIHIVGLSSNMIPILQKCLTLLPCTAVTCTFVAFAENAIVINIKAIIVSYAVGAFVCALLVAGGVIAGVVAGAIAGVVAGVFAGLFKAFWVILR